MMSESRVMSDVVSFFLIVVDEDRKQFAVEGPLTDRIFAAHLERTSAFYDMAIPISSVSPRHA